MDINNRLSVWDNLSNYDYLCNDKDKIIEITRWTNSEGWDITIGENKNFSLTDGELEAINFLTKCLEYNYICKKNENLCNK